MRNPDWKREELILALELYFKLDYGQMHGRNSNVIRLSEDLKKLDLHSIIPQPEKFRSVNSVSLKLANFKKLDRNFTGKGMRDGAKLDCEIWKEFHRHRDTLKKEASLIRQIYLDNKSELKSQNNVSHNSGLLFYIHRNRETDPLLVNLKRKNMAEKTGSDECEICGFDSFAQYGELGNVVMEIHYIKDLKTIPKIESSDLDDFIVVCSNCHKILNENFGLIFADDLKQIIRKK